MVASKHFRSNLYLMHCDGTYGTTVTQYPLDSLKGVLISEVFFVYLYVSWHGPCIIHNIVLILSDVLSEGFHRLP